ncbi:MAG: hypothetical protein AAGU75_16140 [Bacillota bacterium]
MDQDKSLLYFHHVKLGIEFVIEFAEDLSMSQIVFVDKDKQVYRFPLVELKKYIEVGN